MIARTGARTLALGAYAGLILLILAWEAWLAPAGATPRWFWLVVKLAPLMIPLPGLIRRNAKTYLVAALVVLLYFIEGAVLAFGAANGLERAGVLPYALLEVALTLAFFASAAYYVRLTGLDSALRARE